MHQEQGGVLMSRISLGYGENRSGRKFFMQAVEYVSSVGGVT